MNRTWVKIVFVVSLVLNLFLIGAAAGVLTLGARMAHGGPAPPGGAGGGQLWRASLALPPDQAREFRQGLRREAMAMRPQAEANRAARMAAWRLGTHDPFDGAAVKAALARAREGDQAVRARLEERLVDLAAALPPERRHAIFQIMSEPPPRPLRRGFPMGPPPPGAPPPGPAVNGAPPPPPEDSGAPPP